MAEIDSLEIKITANAEKANTAIRHLTRSLGALSTSLKFDTTSLEKLGKINGNNFKKLSEGLQSFANAAKSLQNVDGNNFKKLSDGLTKIASIDSSKLEVLGRIDGNSFRGLGEGVKALSAGLQNLQGIKKSDFNRLASGVERLAAIQPGNMEAVGNSLRPLADGVNILSNAKFDNKNLQSLINSLTRLSNANTGSLANIDFSKLGNSIKSLADTLSGAEKVQQNTISMTNAIAKLASAGANVGIVTTTLPHLGNSLKEFIQTMTNAAKAEADTIIFTQAIATLVNAGNRVETTANSLKKLGEELKKFLDLMSGVQTINENTIKMVQALAKLANQGGKVGSATKDINNALNKMNSGMAGTGTNTLKLARNFKNLAKQLLGSMGIYVGIYGVVRGLKNAIVSTTDYIEAFNYYEVAFGKIASEWQKDFDKYGEKAGVSTAEEYAESFTKRMNETLGKLSGVQVNVEAGLLEETGMKNLGLNIQQVTQYASQLASVTNSIGQTGETSLAVANSFTKLAGDISSLFNVDFQSVANNLQSGLIGQSRALYKYGIDITNATLQTYAYNLGIEKFVSKMTQAEKMQLRMIAILDQSKVSWGDLANTINSPSNMLRQFTNNAKEFAIVLGQLFMPILQKVMPVLNGLTIALKRLVVSFAQILGIKIDFDAFGQGYSDMSEEIDGVSDSLDDVAESAKEAKAGLRGFDELKVINMPDTSSVGAGGSAGIDLTDEILKATEEYEKVWKEAFDKMENTAQAWADKIEKALEPVKKIFQDFVIGDFFQAGKDVSNLVISITDFFANAIDKVDWYGIGVKIGDFIAGIDWIRILAHIANLIWQALKAGLEAWSGALSSAPIETAIISIFAAPKILKAIASSKLITFLKKIVTGTGLVTKAFMGNREANALLVTQYPKLGKAVKIASDSFMLFKQGVANKNIFGGIKDGIQNVRNNLTKLQKGAITAVAGFAEFKIVSETFKGLINGSEDTATGILKIVGAVAAAGAALSLAFPAPVAIAITAATGLIATITGITSAQEEMAKKLADDKEIARFGDTVDNITAKLKEGIGEAKKRAEESTEYIQSAGVAETMFAQDLADKYFNLAEQEELTNDQKKQMQDLAKQLVQTLPDLQGYYDTETGLLTTSREKVDELIESRLREIRLNAIEEKLTEEFGKQADMLKKLQDATIDVKKAQEHVNEAQTKYNDLAKKVEAFEEYENLKDQIGLTGDATGELKARQEELQKFLTDNGATEFPTFDALREALADSEDDLNHTKEEHKKFYDILSGVHGEYEDILNNIDTFSGMMESSFTEAGQNSMDNLNNTIVNEAETVLDSTEDLAENVTTTYNNTLDKGIRNTENAMSTWMGKALAAGAIKLEINSPSKAMKKLGEYTVQGYNKGIGSSESERSTTNIISSYVSNVLGEFSKVIDPLTRIGVDAMKGLNSGLESMENSIYVKAGNIAGNVAKTVMNSLEMHSPSRVMFRLGGYTMQGFQNGLENLYQPILSSVKGFSKDLVYTPEPNLSDIYENYQYSPTPYITQYNNSGYQNNGYAQNNTETNALLRRQNELLEALLNKPTLNNGDIFNAARTVYKGEAMRRYGNSEAFDPVWG